MTQSAPGFLLHLRLFLEGIEVPVISAGVTATIGSGATATIDIVPDDTLDQILPRTTVHLFYLDSFAFKASNDAAPRDAHYKLLFAGEVFSISSSKAGMGSRTVSLNCLDFSNVLDTNYIYQFKPARGDTQDNSIIRNTSKFLTTLDSKFDSIINSPSEVIRQLSSASPSWEGSTVQTSLLGGLFSIIERLLGVQGLYYGTNGWITIQERRTRFLESIISDSGETAAKIYDATQFSGWLTGRLAQEGQVVTFRRLVDIICEFIFYSMAPNPVAKYVKGESSKFPGLPNRDIPARPPPAPTGSGDAAGFAQFGGNTGGKNITGLKAEFRDAVLPVLTEVHAQLQAKQLPSGRAAKVHIVRGYVDKSENARSRHLRGLAIDMRFEYDENVGDVDASLGGVFPNIAARTGKLRPTTRDTWYGRLYNAVVNLGRLISDLLILEAAIKANPNVYNKGNLDLLDQDIAVAKDYLVFGSFLRRAARGSGLKVLPKFNKDVTDPIFETILKMGDDPVHIQFDDTATVETAIEDQGELIEPASENTPRERLHSFVFRPDVWFVVPPKSNIIFPDMLQSFNTQREMMRETTRLQLDVGNDLAAESTVVSTTFFAPQIKGQESLDSQGTNDASKLLIYDHEKFSGVIPKFERMLDTIFFIEQAPAATTETGNISYLAGFAPKVAHFHLLSERYRARSASVALTFSPHIICGFPAAVLDAIITADELASKDISLSRSFKLGLVESVSHSISQGGAQTQVRLTHVRSHRTGDKSDDLFANTVTNTGSVELTLQDPKFAGAVSEKEGTFGCEATKILNQPGEDSEYGFKAIAALFNFNSIEELIQGAVREPNSPPIIDLLENYPFNGAGVNADASASVPVVTFSPTPYRTKTVKSGTWQGSPTMVYLTVGSSVLDVSSIESDPTATQITVSAAGPVSPFTFQPLTSNINSDSSFQLIAFSAGTALAIIPLLLPGSKFVADVGDEVSETGKVNPVEESIRPIWISNDYSVQSITEKIYEPFFGTSAITNDIQAKKFLLPSVEEAVDQLAKLYAKEVVQVDNRQAGADFPAPLHWIYEYTYRPVATYTDILGSKTYDPITKKNVGPVDINNEKFKYFGGFHSNAVTSGLKEYGKELAFLDIKGAGLQHQGASAGNPNPFTLEGADGDRLDPRADRAQRVLSYKSAIKGASAIGSGPTSQNGIAKRG
jgi:hypothetical protein